MGKGGQNVEAGAAAGGAGTGGKQQLSWEEVAQHTERTDKWLVIDGEVYDVTRWSRKHPGGSKILTHFAGQDASEAFRAFHNDEKSVRKFLKPIHIGTVLSKEEKEAEMKKDFAELRETVTKMGLFKPSITFFTLSIVQLIALEAFAYWVLSTYGTGWVPYTVALIALGTLQAQASWIQHDYGHLSVFKSSFWNHVFHQYTMNISKGASAHWWSHMHYQHHAKPNVIDKDPDVRLDVLFVIGDTMAKTNAVNKKSMPYNWQHRYFFATLPPLLFPTYFQYMTFRHCITRRAWLDIATMMMFYARFLYLFSPMLGVLQTVFFYFLVRSFESHWFVWVSQSNHIPMEVEKDKERPWLALQMHATCDIEKGIFNDWFTGHLNFQIEHHLFPTMPRHNLYKAAPLVKSLCQKHNIPYTTKPLLTAFRDIVNTLEHSGQIWSAYYHAYHVE